MAVLPRRGPIEAATGPRPERAVDLLRREE